MASVVDIFNPSVSKVAEGLEGKIITIYGGNGLGKTYTAAHMSKPFFLACESGLNAIAGINYIRITDWANFKKVVRQLTSKATVEKARELYDTIVIDELYASSIFCQDFILNTYGEGALTFGDVMGKRNLYKLYEDEFFRVINQLLSADYTVVFIGHAQEKDGFTSPKGDKRCLAPIIDNSDFVIYVSSNGIDEQGKVIFSTGHFAQTGSFFARSRFTECVPEITPFSAENLEKAINDAISAEEKKSGITAITYEELKEQNITVSLTYEEIMNKIQESCVKLAEAGHGAEAVEIIENILGPGAKVANCTKRQMDALNIILDDIQGKASELNITLE